MYRSGKLHLYAGWEMDCWDNNGREKDVRDKDLQNIKLNFEKVEQIFLGV
jgi:hypothetical protein